MDKSFALKTLERDEENYFFQKCNKPVSSLRNCLNTDIFSFMSKIEALPQTAVFTRESIESSKPLEDMVMRNAEDLSVFLMDSKISLVKVTGVFPSTRFGISFTLDLGKVLESEGDTATVEWFSTNSSSVYLLENMMRTISKKERKGYKRVKKGIKMIKSVVENPEYWNLPFNPGVKS